MCGIRPVTVIEANVAEFERADRLGLDILDQGEDESRSEREWERESPETVATAPQPSIHMQRAHNPSDGLLCFSFHFHFSFPFHSFSYGVWT